MRVETHDGLKRPQSIQSTRVIVYDDFNNPIGLFVQLEPGHVVCQIADDAVAFNRMLRSLGLDRTLIVDTIKGPEQPLVR